MWLWIGIGNRTGEEEKMKGVGAVEAVYKAGRMVRIGNGIVGEGQRVV